MTSYFWQDMSFWMRIVTLCRGRSIDDTRALQWISPHRLAGL
jgi:hypothetical protein